ncbi:Uncharacterised protein [Enterobacter cloacae]|nr:Uncharacterised protein [Enterobacter cloacae]VAU69125.1 Uncharacterised protein [Klebsiella pneumoniae]
MKCLGCALRSPKKRKPEIIKNSGTLTREAEFRTLATSQLTGLILCAFVTYQVVVWIITTIRQAIPRRLSIQLIFDCISSSVFLIKKV